MKLRIQKGSLRLRLTQSEVAQLHDTGRVESSIEFAAGAGLAYALEGSTRAAGISASFDGHAIVVTVPLSRLKQWAESKDVTIEDTPEGGVHLLIEKDFQCLHKPHQRDPDAYPNPQAS